MNLAAVENLDPQDSLESLVQREIKELLVLREAQAFKALEAILANLDGLVNLVKWDHLAKMA